MALRNNDVAFELVRGAVFFGLIMPLFVAGLVVIGNLFY